MAILPKPRRKDPSDLPMTAPAGVGAAVAQELPTSRKNMATASLAKPMDQLRSEAYGGEGFSGPMPSGPRRVGPPSMLAQQQGTARPFNAPEQNQMGTMAFKNLQPRRPAAGPAAPAMAARDPGTELLPPPDNPPTTPPTEQSYAGFAPYVDEQTGGAPRRLSGYRGRRAGARYTEGPSKGKTQDQALLKARTNYAKFSPEKKGQYESMARNEDISTTVPGVAGPVTSTPATPEPPARMSIDGADLAPLKPGLVPNVAKDAPMPEPRRKVGRFPGARSYDRDEDDY